MHRIPPGLKIAAISTWLLWPVHAYSLVTYSGTDGVYQNIFNSNPVERCLNCHHSSLPADGSRSAAPLGVDFNTYALSMAANLTYGTNAAGAVSRVTDGTMPAAGSLVPHGLHSLISQWSSDGFLNHTAPSVTTLSPTSVLSDRATLNANISQNGLATNAWFRFSAMGSPLGSSPQYNFSAIGSGGGLSAHSFSYTITGLDCSTNYHYRAQASNSDGTTNGNGMGNINFSTASCSNPVITYNGGANQVFSISTNESPNAFSPVVLSATDVDGTSGLSWSISTPSNGGSAFFSGGNSGASVTLDYNPPDASYSGTDVFTITVSDDTPGTALTDSITVTVNIGMQPPVISGASSVTMDEDSTPLAFSLLLNANDPDSNNNNLSWNISSAASNGVASVTSGSGSSQSINYTPDANLSGNAADSFNVRAVDPQGNDDIFMVTVNITAYNDPPIAVSDNLSVHANSSNNLLDVLANDTDVDLADTRRIIAINTSGTLGTVSINNPASTNNSLSYTPATDSQTPDTFSYTMRDTAGLMSMATVNISFIDTDSDGVSDTLDNCPAVSNPAQQDNDTDGLGNACDNDPNGLGILNTFIEFNINQGVFNGSNVFQGTGNVTVIANLETTSSGSLSHDWSQTDSRLLAQQINLNNDTFIFDPSTLDLGSYLLDVSITNNGSTSRNTQLINIVATTPPALLNTEDTDGDSLDDFTETFSDDDQDGIPNHRDHNSFSINQISTRTTVVGSKNIKSQTNTRLSIGKISQASSSFSATVSQQDIENFSINGQPVTNTIDDSYTGASEIFDFIISSIPQTGSSAEVVLHLGSSTRNDTVVRTYTVNAGWQDFIIDSNNHIASTASIAGNCPDSDSSNYETGLKPFNDCIRLRIEDGGANDADGLINGVISQTSKLAISTSQKPEETSPCDQQQFNNCASQSGNIGSLSISALIALAFLFLTRHFITRRI